jgi:hypothetical protein
MLNATAPDSAVANLAMTAGCQFFVGLQMQIPRWRAELAPANGTNVFLELWVEQKCGGRVRFEERRGQKLSSMLQHMPCRRRHLVGISRDIGCL